MLSAPGKWFVSFQLSCQVVLHQVGRRPLRRFAYAVGGPSLTGWRAGGHGTYWYLQFNRLQPSTQTGPSVFGCRVLKHGIRFPERRVAGAVHNLLIWIMRLGSWILFYKDEIKSTWLIFFQSWLCPTLVGHFRPGVGVKTFWSEFLVEQFSC